MTHTCRWLAEVLAEWEAKLPKLRPPSPIEFNELVVGAYKDLISSDMGGWRQGGCSWCGVCAWHCMRRARQLHFTMQLQLQGPGAC